MITGKNDEPGKTSGATVNGVHPKRYGSNKLMITKNSHLDSYCKYMMISTVVLNLFYCILANILENRIDTIYLPSATCFVISDSLFLTNIFSHILEVFYSLILLFHFFACMSLRILLLVVFSFLL